MRTLGGPSFREAMPPRLLRESAPMRGQGLTPLSFCCHKNGCRERAFVKLACLHGLGLTRLFRVDWGGLAPPR